MAIGTAARSTRARPQAWGRISITLKNFWLDILLFLAFVVDMNVRLTGLAIHEWLGIGLGLALAYHVALHWDWVVAVTRRLLGRLPTVQRVKYLVDLALFLDMVLLIATGLWISEVALPGLGWSVAQRPIWRQIHHVTAELSLWLAGLHLALNWGWIADAWRRYVWQPLARWASRLTPRHLTPVPVEGDVESAGSDVKREEGV